jgi:putative sigma-54 modulation protein
MQLVRPQAEKDACMDTPVEINFHGIEKSEAIEQRVREKVGKLKRHFDRMTHCRVVLEAPHRNAAKAKVYQVKIEIGVPGRKPLIISHDREGAHAQDDLGLAVRDAFEAAVRRIDEVSAKLSARTKQERGRRKPAEPNGSVEM